MTFVCDWEQIKEKNQNVAHHAFLIIGVRNAKEGIKCQVQDTNIISKQNYSEFFYLSLPVWYSIT